MKIYCGKCIFVEDIGDQCPPRRCPICDSEDLRFETDESGWHSVCWQWAMANGWKEKPVSSLSMRRHYYSLPEWYYRKGKLEEWEKFKELLSDPSRITPPDLKINKGKGYDRDELVKYWYTKTGLVDVWERANEDLAKGRTFFNTLDLLSRFDPTTRSLGKAYLEYWEKVLTSA